MFSTEWSGGSEPTGVQGSYVNTNLGFVGTLKEFRNLFRMHDIPTRIRRALEDARALEVEISKLLGVPVAGLKLLEIGPGQKLVQLSYFGIKNEAVGIDLDFIMQRLNLRGSLRMLKQNGWLRTCKTVGRKLARIDVHTRKELRSQLGSQTTPNLRVLRMDATKMSFPDNQFDVVFSRATFEHLANPAAVVSEIRRVLKPGGVMSIGLHLFTCDSGCHDTRILAGQRGDLPYWAHLRPEHERKIRPNSYVNRLRLADWVRVFQSEMPGCKVKALQDTSEVFRRELGKLRSQGELMDYSDEELYAYGVEAIWRKPPQAPVSGSAQLVARQ
jgi:ubiquinone/menaquinone biosynthesis C-methylase UbiE